MKLLVNIAASTKHAFFPSGDTTTKLFLIGATVGPLVDSLHNQCLLEYDVLPVNVYLPHISSDDPIFATSWLIPPLLGIAYVILGGILPRVMTSVLSSVGLTADEQISSNASVTSLKKTATVAVLSTALIIRLSEFLQTHSTGDDGVFNLILMVIASMAQWTLLGKSVLFEDMLLCYFCALISFRIIRFILHGFDRSNTCSTGGSITNLS